jgi:predicted phosphodiesterase
LIQTVAFADVIKFAQVADAHFRTNDAYRAEVLKDTVNSINEQSGLSFVIFTGDNIDSAKENNLSEFVKIINKLKIPYYIVIGDHDVFKNGGLSKTHYFEVIHANNCFYRNKKPNYVFKKNGFVFIVVDGAKEVIPGSIGYYKEDTLNWLEKQLKKHKKDKVVIFQHFPLITENEILSHSVYQKENYLKILDDNDNVMSVVAGHLHKNSEIMRNGVYHITTPTLLSDTPVYKVISISTTKGFSPMVYTELKEVEIPKI